MNNLHAAPSLAGALFCGALLLTACSTETTTTSAPVVEETTPQKIETGTFDRNDPNFEFYSICEELRSEDWEELSLVPVSEPAVDLAVPISTCSFKDLGLDYRHIITVNTGALTDEQLRNEIKVFSEDSSAKYTGVWTFELNGGAHPAECNASISMPRGRLIVMHDVLRFDIMTREESCQEAIDLVERIYGKAS